MEQTDVRGGIGTRPMAIGTAAVLTLAGVVVMLDSVRVGMGWGSDGPQAGYFPFYVGLLLSVSSLVTLAHALRQSRATIFVGWPALRQVMAMLWPTAVFTALIGPLGVYLAGMIYIAYFMSRHGRYPVQVTIPVAIGIPVGLFFTFEVWFLVPLPKGPIETWLGF